METKHIVLISGIILLALVFGSYLTTGAEVSSEKGGGSPSGPVKPSYFLSLSTTPCTVEEYDECIEYTNAGATATLAYSQIGFLESYGGVNYFEPDGGIEYKCIGEEVYSKSGTDQLSCGDSGCSHDFMDNQGLFQPTGKLDGFQLICWDGDELSWAYVLFSWKSSYDVAKDSDRDGIYDHRGARSDLDQRWYKAIFNQLFDWIWGIINGT
jgi:hypothetical protein